MMTEVQELNTEIQALGGYRAYVLQAEEEASGADKDFDTAMLADSGVSASNAAMEAIGLLINNRLGKYQARVNYSPESLSIAFEAEGDKPAAEQAAPAAQTAADKAKQATDNINKQDAKPNTDGKFKATIKKVWNAIKNAFMKVIQFITKFFKKMFGSIYKARRIAIYLAKTFEGMGLATKVLSGYKGPAKSYMHLVPGLGIADRDKKKISGDFDISKVLDFYMQETRSAPHLVKGISDNALKLAADYQKFKTVAENAVQMGASDDPAKNNEVLGKATEAILKDTISFTNILKAYSGEKKQVDSDFGIVFFNARFGGKVTQETNFDIQNGPKLIVQYRPEIFAAPPSAEPLDDDSVLFVSNNSLTYGDFVKVCGDTVKLCDVVITEEKATKDLEKMLDAIVKSFDSTMSKYENAASKDAKLAARVKEVQSSGQVALTTVRTFVSKVHSLLMTTCTSAANEALNLMMQVTKQKPAEEDKAE